eukprot:Em0010g371a
MGKHHSKLSPEMIEELVNRTHFSHHDLRKWYKGFMKDCPDGMLTLERFAKAYSKMFSKGDPSRFVEHAFRVFDAKHDGVIDFEEYICAIAVSANGKLEEKLGWVFNMYDLDGDGYIGKDDLLEILRSIYQMVGTGMLNLPADELTPEDRSAKMFALMDTNKDDKLSLEEFINGVKSDQSILDLLRSH